MLQTLGFTIELPVPFDEAMRRTRDALKAEGFGVLTEIDIEDAFREKLGVKFHPYAILGACNPRLAYRALSAEPEVGLLLPCNVTIESSTEDASTVRIADPAVMLSAGGMATLNEEVREVAAEARERLERVATALRA